MKRGLIVALVTLAVLLVSLASVSAFWPFDLFKKIITGNVVNGTSLNNSASCIDSDKGVFASVPGNVTYKKFLFLTGRVKDSCVGSVGVSGSGYAKKGEQVKEYYCRNGRAASTVVNCPTRTACKEMPEGAACAKTSVNANEIFSFVDYSAFDSLPDTEKTLAVAEAKALDEKYAVYWSPIPESKQYGLNQDVTKQAYYATLKSNWEQQKQSLLDELVLQKKYGVFNDGTNGADYDVYVNELKIAWDEQEESQPWSIQITEADSIPQPNSAFTSSSSGGSGSGYGSASTNDDNVGNIIDLDPAACNGGRGEEILFPTYKIDKKKCPSLYNIFPNGVSIASQSKMYEYVGYYTNDGFICKEVLSSVYSYKPNIATFCESCPERDVSMLRINNYISKFEDYRNCFIGYTINKEEGMQRSQSSTLINELVHTETITYSNSNILNCNYYDKYVKKADCKPYRGIYMCNIDEGVKATTHYNNPSNTRCIDPFPPMPDAVDQPVNSPIYFDVSAEECKAPEYKKCGSLCCAKEDSCQASVPVCCPPGYKIVNKICVVDCPKNLKSCTWGCCPKNEICGTAGFCIANKKCPKGTTDCPADDPDDNAKDCCKTDGSETCMSTGGIYEVYFCSANRCGPNQELCKIEIPKNPIKTPFPKDFAICCNTGKCSHFPNGQPYCKS